MKELTIEEKAKRHDEVIKQLRTMMPNWESLSYNGKTFLQDLVHIIPELKESEDWIPKEIIKYLKEKGDFRSCWIAWLEKQGEQKPTIEMKTPEESLGIDSDTYNKIVDECVYGEQKPAWSEEDKDFMYDTLSNLTELKDRYGEGYGNVGKCIDWLKSLKERYTWKPSESDILLLERIANGKSDPQNFQASLCGLIGQLKKLREG